MKDVYSTEIIKTNSKSRLEKINDSDNDFVYCNISSYNFSWCEASVTASQKV